MFSEQFVVDALEAERSGIQFPINLNDVWEELGYTRKDTAVERLTHDLIRGEDYTTEFRKSAENSTGGRSERIFMLSTDGYDHFCMLARTHEGRLVRKQFIQYKKAYLANLENLFNRDTNALEELKQENQQLKNELKVFTEQLSDELNCDVLELWHMLGLRTTQGYLLDHIQNNFSYGKDYTLQIVNGKRKYYVTPRCRNYFLFAIRTIDGVDISNLPPHLIIETEQYFKRRTGQKNKLFPNRR